MRNNKGEVVLLKVIVICMWLQLPYIIIAGSERCVSWLKKAQSKDLSIKSAYLRELVETFNIEIIVETGTGNSRTLEKALPYFREIHTIKTPPIVYARTAHKFKNNNHVHVYLGESADVLCKILPIMKGKILFILDSHTDIKTTTRRDFTPIFQEIRAIIACGINDAVILINNIHYFREAGYPSDRYIRDAILDINGNYQFIMHGNNALAYLP